MRLDPDPLALREDFSESGYLPPSPEGLEFGWGAALPPTPTESYLPPLAGSVDLDLLPGAGSLRTGFGYIPPTTSGNTTGPWHYQIAITSPKPALSLNIEGQPYIFKGRELGGIVQENFIPASRIVRVYDHDTGALLAETQSNSQGAWGVLIGVDFLRAFVVILGADSPPTFNAKVIDKLKPRAVI